MVGFLFKFLLVLILFGGIGLVGYAYLADMAPAAQEIVQPIEIHVD